LRIVFQENIRKK